MKKNLFKKFLSELDYCSLMRIDIKEKIRGYKTEKIKLKTIRASKEGFLVVDLDLNESISLFGIEGVIELKKRKIKRILKKEVVFDTFKEMIGWFLKDWVFLKYDRIEPNQKLMNYFDLIVKVQSFNYFNRNLISNTDLESKLKLIEFIEISFDEILEKEDLKPLFDKLKNNYKKELNKFKEQNPDFYLKIIGEVNRFLSDGIYLAYNLKIDEEIGKLNKEHIKNGWWQWIY